MKNKIVLICVIALLVILSGCSPEKTIIEDTEETTKEVEGSTFTFGNVSNCLDPRDNKKICWNLIDEVPLIEGLYFAVPFDENIALVFKR